MSRICLVDDDMYFAEDMIFFIEEVGHTVHVWKCADDVIERFAELSTFDFIILDIMMMKGRKIEEDYTQYETGEILYEKIRREYPNKEIVVISAKNAEDINIDFDGDSHIQFIQKPMTSNKIKKILYLFSKDA